MKTWLALIVSLIALGFSLAAFSMAMVALIAFHRQPI
jgi:hypothetical protein